ncbi:MAG: hypothetical protein NUW21_02575, partial [Elusimicrobia bacterium]|nr:hypothetical protein [Elusimicrobiota bacterium]
MKAVAGSGLFSPTFSAMIKAVPAPAWLSAGFVGLSLFYFSRVFDVSGFTYMIVATEGLAKTHQAAHPLYVPFLTAVASLMSGLGVPGHAPLAFQLLSLLAGAALLWTLHDTLSAWSGDRWASLWAALIFGLQGQFWYFCMQTKPYALAACFSALALRPIAGPRREHWRGGLLAGLSVGLAIGFCVVSAALLPCAWLWFLVDRKRFGRAWLIAFHAVLAALLPVYLAMIPAGLLGAFARALADSGLPSRFGPRALEPVLAAFASKLGHACADAVWLLPWAFLSAAALIVGRDPLPRQAAAIAAAIIASFAAVFLLFDAGNDYVFILLLPV